MDKYSIWLLPEKDSRSRFRDIILRLSKKLKAPGFHPHCTLYGRLDIPIGKIIPVASYLSKSIDQFSTIVKKLKTGRTKWKSLYLTIEKKEEMEKSYNYCKKLFLSSRNYLFDPHISIAYGNFTPEKLHYATKGIDIPKHLSFSSIAVVRTGENIEEWEVVFQRHLKAE